MLWRYKGDVENLLLDAINSTRLIKRDMDRHTVTPTSAQNQLNLIEEKISKALDLISAN